MKFKMAVNHKLWWARVKFCSLLKISQSSSFHGSPSPSVQCPWKALARPALCLVPCLSFKVIFLLISGSNLVRTMEN